MATIDWVIVGAYFALTIAIGLRFSKRASASTSEYFVSGRSLPWWLAGTSMVATTFAADTPLAVTGIVAKEGIAGNWVWWAFLPGGLATVFFFAALWRRARVVTDVELISIRYSGRPARALRTFRAVYLGVLMNGIIIGWVNAAMAKILGATLDIDKNAALGICLTITVAYATLSGLWGVVVADFVQFIIGMVGTIALAFFAVDAVGGLGALKDKLETAHHPTTNEPYDVDQLLSFVPSDAPWSIPMITFGVFLFVNWWSSWYPGAEPGGGGYIAQRMFASKSERHAMFAGLWFNCAHYALRPWPWIIAGLCGIALYGNTLIGANGQPDPELNYVQVILDHLPTGWRGLLIAAFAAAYMSTISTQLNWGSSYLVNDLYRPLVTGGRETKGEVKAARLLTLVILLVSLIITMYIDSIAQAWMFLMALGAGTGLVLMLRWYWWRINAWSEISSMVTALITSVILFQLFANLSYGTTVAITVGVTTVVWIVVTMLTSAENHATLASFCERVRPPGPGWRRITPDAPPLHAGPRLLAWAGGLAVVYGVLFGVGHLLIGTNSTGWTLLAVSVAGAAVMSQAIRHPCFADPD
jgi:SSS family transporter